MFGLFTSKRSPVRKRLESVAGVRRTWIEWMIEDGIRTPTLVVECEWDLDPASPEFDADAFAQIMSAANRLDIGEGPPPRVRVIPYASGA